MDAGNPDAESRKEARGEEFINDPKGMAAAIVQDVGGEAVSYSVMRGPATAQEGEAHSINTMIVGVQLADLPLATLERAAWTVGDSQSASAATKSYYEDPKAHCMMSGISSQVHKGKPIVMTRLLNVVITPSHRFTSCNRLADKTVLLKHKALGHWLLRRPLHFAPPEVQGDQYQLGPKALGKYLQRKCTADLVAWQKKNFPPYSRAWQRGRGVPVEWFTPMQQRHILLQRCGTVPVMVEIARRMSSRDVTIPDACWFCGRPDTRQHAWDCMSTIDVATYLEEELRDWVRKYWYCERQTDRGVEKETWGSGCLVVWAMATTTDGFQTDKLSVAAAESMGVQFLIQAVDASMRQHAYRYAHRQEFFRRQYPQMSSIRQWLHALLEGKRSGGREEEEDEEAEQEVVTMEGKDGTGWITDEDEEEWAERFLAEAADDLVGESCDEEDEWLRNDDIRVP